MCSPSQRVFGKIYLEKVFETAYIPLHTYTPHSEHLHVRCRSDKG
jgi:hypothetical protein